MGQEPLLQGKTSIQVLLMLFPNNLRDKVSKGREGEGEREGERGERGEGEEGRGERRRREAKDIRNLS
jgi:hypothetical protein